MRGDFSGIAGGLFFQLIPITNAKQVGDLVNEVGFAAGRAVVAVGNRLDLSGEWQHAAFGVERGVIRRTAADPIQEEGGNSRLMLFWKRRVHPTVSDRIVRGNLTGAADQTQRIC